MKFFLIIALVIAVVFGVIAFQNPDLEISITFIKWTITKPAIVVTAVPFGVGLIIGILLVVPGWIKKGKQSRMHKRRVTELEEELARAQDQVDQLSLAEEELPEETDIEEEERKGPGDIY